MASRSINTTLPNPNSIQIEIKLNGKWSGLDKLSYSLKPAIQKGYEVAVSRFANSLLKVVRRSLTTGTPPQRAGVVWSGLSKYTIDRYGDHPIMNLTGMYARSIGIHEYKSRTLVGLPINKRSSQGGITLNQLAILLEYGTKNLGEPGSIPARPLWNPALTSVGGVSGLKQAIITEIRRQLFKQTGIRPNQVR